MRLLSRIILASVLLGASVAALAADVFVIKLPDLGDYWHPLSNQGGTYVYADSFVAPISGTVSGMGLWLDGGAPDIQLRILDSIGGDPTLGPDSSALLASSMVLPGQTFSTLTFSGASAIFSPTMLVAGHTYWFAAAAVGGQGAYTVGAHTQNSGGIVDNGTFWFSNDPAGVLFDGRNLTPEMAFEVGITPVPEPTEYAMLGVGLGLLGFTARRRTRA